jgi:fatty-acyl-CoA synthase
VRWIEAAELWKRVDGSALRLHPSRAWRSRITLLTSGTTGTPRGVRQARRLSQIWPTLALAGGTGMRPGWPVLVCPPLCHGHGLSLALLCMVTGSPMVLPGPRTRSTTEAKGEAIWQALTGWRVRVLAGTPTHLRFLAAYLDSYRPERHEREAVSVVLSGSDWLDTDTVQTLSHRWAVPVRDFYGTSQNSTLTAKLRWGTAHEAGVAGRPVAGSRLRVVDETGRVVRRGVAGSIEARSSLAGVGMTGGVGSAANRGRASRGAGRVGSPKWTATGDRGYLDQSGQLHLLGRADSLVRSGGTFASPERLWQFLVAVPGVSQAWVGTVPDPVYGQRLTARLCSDGSAPVDPEELRAKVRQTLGPAMVPRRIEILPPG